MKRLFLPALILAVAAGAPASAGLVGDGTRGAELYEAKCGACHSLDGNRVGPAHRGVYGRKSGSVAGFAYSSGVKSSKLVWNDITLDRWLANPQATIRGARMGYRLEDPQERADVIAYLKQQSPAKR
jgi:cytochrome c